MKYLLLPILLLLAYSTKAQQYQYIPMDTSGASWQVISVSTWSGPPHNYVQCMQENLQYTQTGKDSIINGEKHKLVTVRKKEDIVFLAQSPCPLPSTEPISATKPDIVGLAIREVNKQVFFSSQHTSVIYDFNLQVGQSSPYMGKVTAIDTIQIGNSLRKRFFVLYGGIKDTIIEGIGSLKRGLDLVSAPPNGKVILTCYSLNGNILFDNPAAHCGAIFPYGTPTSINETHQDTPLVYPNPFDYEIIIKTEQETDIALYNSVGRLIGTFKQKGNTRISTIELPAGLYMLIIKDAPGNISTHKLLKL